MALHPLPSELIRDQEFETLVEHIGRHPAMVVNPPTLAGVIGFIDGYNRGRGGSPLLGLREWLVVRAQGGNNLHWSGLACRELLGDHYAATTRDRDPELVPALCRLLAEFLVYREANGLSFLFWEYAEWLRRQEWYSGPLPPLPVRDAEQTAAADRGIAG